MTGYTIQTVGNNVNIIGDVSGLKTLIGKINEAIETGNSATVQEGKTVLTVVCEKSWTPR